MPSPASEFWGYVAPFLEKDLPPDLEASLHLGEVSGRAW